LDEERIERRKGRLDDPHLRVNLFRFFDWLEVIKVAILSTRSIGESFFVEMISFGRLKKNT
jgi:hypothetical protein